MIESNEVEDLENLVKSPGWQRVMRWAGQEWADQIGSQVAVAANEVNDVMALNKLRQIVAAKKAVQRVLEWPDGRLHTLKTNAAKADHGPLLSRRGGL